MEASSSRGTTGKLSRRSYVLLFSFALILYFITASGRSYSYDGITMFAMTKSIVDRQSITIDVDPEYPYSKYAPFQSVLAIPMYVAAKAVSPVMGRFAPEEMVEEWIMGMFNVIISALSVMVMAAAVIELGVSARGAIATALLWGFATMAWPYAKMDFSEPLLTLLLLLVLIYCMRSVRLNHPGYAIAAAVIFGISVLTKYANVVLAPIFFLAILGNAEGRLKRAAGFFVPVMMSVVIVLLFNYLRFGDMFETGYDLVREFDAKGPWYECVYGVLFSSGKSIFVYSPPLILALVGLKEFLKKNRMFALCVGLSLIAYFVVYSRTIVWGGGLSWGPRYFFPIMGMGMWMAAPFVASALERNAPKWRLWLIVVLALAGLAVQGLAISVRMNTAYENGAVDMCVHMWMSQLHVEEKEEMPPICRNPIDREWEILRMRAPRTLELGVAAIKGELGPGDKEFEHTYLDYWYVYLLPKLPRAAIIGLLAFVSSLAVVAGYLLILLLHDLREPPLSSPQA